MVLLLAVSRGEECVRVRVLGWRWRGGVGVGGGTERTVAGEDGGG